MFRQYLHTTRPYSNTRAWAESLHTPCFVNRSARSKFRPRVLTPRLNLYDLEPPNESASLKGLRADQFFGSEISSNTRHRNPLSRRAVRYRTPAYKRYCDCRRNDSVTPRCESCSLLYMQDLCRLRCNWSRSKVVRRHNGTAILMVYTSWSAFVAAYKRYHCLLH